MKEPIKKLITIKVMLAMFILSLPVFSTAADAGSLYGGLMTVSGASFHREGDMLRIRMRVSYEPEVLKSNESLTLTPEIKSGGSVYRLPSTIVNGSALERSEHRTEALTHRRRSGVAVVMSDRAQGLKYFIYDATVPYSGWMKDGAVYIEVKTCDCNGHRPHVYEDMAFNKFTVKDSGGMGGTSSSDVAAGEGTKVSGIAYADINRWVSFLPAPEESGRNFTRSGVIMLSGIERYDRRGDGMEGYICDTINDIAKSTANRYRTSLRGVRLTVYGNPTGNYHKDETSAKMIEKS